ncbi:MAG TPA: hypothetical protein VGJ84_05695 [Polyangiaceae bacterium]
MKRSTSNRRSAYALTLTLVVLLWGCGQRQEQSTSDGGAPVDAVLLAFLSRARSAHHLADGLERDKKFEPARAVLLELVTGARPGRLQPEVREVIADTFARLADLSSRLGKFDEADRQVKAGLELVPETTYFQGHLWEVRGVVEERRAEALRGAGDAQAAQAAAQRALYAFEKAMNIQAEVIKRALPLP